jgi:hypothetical protein
MRGTHLEAREEVIVAGDSGRRRGAAWGDDEQFACTGRRGRGREAVGENPHRNAELLEHLLDSGGASSSRSTVAMVAMEELGCLGFSGEDRGCGMGKS